MVHMSLLLSSNQKYLVKFSQKWDIFIIFQEELEAQNLLFQNQKKS